MPSRETTDPIITVFWMRRLRLWVSSPTGIPQRSPPLDSPGVTESLLNSTRPPGPMWRWWRSMVS